MVENISDFRAFVYFCSSELVINKLVGHVACQELGFVLCASHRTEVCTSSVNQEQISFMSCRALDSRLVVTIHLSRYVMDTRSDK